jgi:uncharacterized membrane protein YhaH (DUF805 family)
MTDDTLFETYLQPWKKYFQFSGRASRKEYWTFTLINTAIYLTLVITTAVLNGGDPSSPLGFIVQWAYFIFYIASLVPGLAVTTRRLHDTNRSAWWLLVGLVCGIFLLVFGLQEGDLGANQYGPDPYGYGGDERSDPLSVTAPPARNYEDLNTPRPMEMWRTDDDE